MRPSDLRRLSADFEPEETRRQIRTIEKEPAFLKILRGPYNHIRIWDRSMDPHTYVGDRVLNAVKARLHPKEASLQIFTPPETLLAYTNHPRHTLINFARAQDPSKAFVRAAPLAVMPNNDLILAYGDQGAQVFVLQKGCKIGSLVAYPETPENIEEIFGRLAREAQALTASSAPAPGMPS